MERRGGWGQSHPMRKMKRETARQEVFTLRFKSNEARVIDHKG